MNKLTAKELSEAPPKIQWLHAMATLKNPISMSIYEECIEEYPEYFDEYEKAYNTPKTQ